jgi:ABC-2 type transport system permease protein
MSAADLVGGAVTGPTPPAAVRLRRPSTRLLRSELRLISGRLRNRAGLAVLAAVPIIMAVVVKSTGDGAGGPPFLREATENGIFVALAALTVELPMFLPLAIAMVSGDAVAGEANTGTLRYLLTVPVSRTRLLAVKFVSLCIGAFWAVLAVAVPGVLVGVALFGTGPVLTLSGTQLSTAEGLWRLALVCLYLTVGLSALAAVGLFISTLTEQPIAAAIAVMIFTIVSWILDGISQVAWLHPWLVVHDWLAYADIFRDPIAWDGIRHGVFVAAVYIVVFTLAAWARFANRDVTS